jgi:hypothetical protein
MMNRIENLLIDQRSREANKMKNEDMTYLTSIFSSDLSSDIDIFSYPK